MMDKIDGRFIIKVADYMELPRPKHRSRFIYNDGEFLPIILVGVGV